MRPIVLAVLLVLALPRWGQAQLVPPATGSPSAQCEAAIAGATRGSPIPPNLLVAIGRVESGRPDPQTGRVQPWPWTLNAEGQSMVFASKAAAIAEVQRLQARGVRSIDVGCMQVNLMHHPQAFASLEEAFDPAANARYAARFLMELFQRAGAWPVAAAQYHSSTPALGEAYGRRVAAAWTGSTALASPRFAMAYDVTKGPPRRDGAGLLVPTRTTAGGWARGGLVRPSARVARLLATTE
ncbi:MAG: lytic transglycosylase domain-containing protein [Acetobacteraceae bacterium]